MNLKTTEIQDIIDRYSKGTTLKQLGVDYGCSPPTISRLLKRNGIKVRDRGRPPKDGSAVKVKKVPTPTLPLSALPDSTQQKLEEIKRKIIADIAGPVQSA